MKYLGSSSPVNPPYSNCPWSLSMIRSFPSFFHIENIMRFSIIRPSFFMKL